MSPAELLRTRRVFLQSQTLNSRIRTGLMVENVDSTLVYHALGYGIDDVIDINQNDDGLRSSLTQFVTGAGRACEAMIVPKVPIPYPVVIGRIDYVDDIDRKVVTLIAVGYTDREIADILNYSHQVIRNRVSKIMLRSGLRNRTQLSSRHTFEAIEGGEKGEPFFTAWTP